MSQISKQALIVDNSQSFPNNNVGDITPSDLRAFNVNMIDSLVNEIPYQSFTASVTNSINLLNAFTASQQPVFNSLNSFTASQLTINTGYNAATYSLNASVNSLTTEVDQLQTWSSSINEISDNGIVQGTSTRLHFYGLVSASIVQNVNGAIASILIEQDGTKLNSASFNAYTASTEATQSIFSASVATSISSSSYTFTQFSASQNIFNSSVTASVQQLLDLSSSLSGGYATQGELDAVSASFDVSLNSVSASLVNTIDTKLNSSSFNDYTASQGGLNAFTTSVNAYTASNNTKWTTIGLLTGSYATTGSNTFIGNQTIIGSTTITDNTTITGSTIMTGSITITGSAYGNIVSASIVSSTASIDLSRANYFTLTIASDTNINVINSQPGVTATLVINTAGAVSASFSSNVKQSSGSFYVPSISGNIDILSFTAVTPSTVYVVPAYTFV